MKKFELCGDGIHDDTAAIQEMLDSGTSLVELPAPKVHYSISKTLKIHSNQTLKLPETATIKLAPKSNCFMLANAEKDAHDIVITGGIWDFDNINQDGNPFIGPNGYTRNPEWVALSHLSCDPNVTITYAQTDFYTGCIMRFSHITRFSVHDITFKNPVTFCLQMAYVTYFTVENVRFDQNLGNPTAENMDGVHIDGGCRFGCIRNVQGTCYDDVVALNADDLYDGPIEDIEVDGVFGEGSLRGVRILSTHSDVSGISVSNVFGTYYQNCVSISYFYPPSGVRGKFGHISLKNLYGSNALRIPECNKTPGYDKYMFSFVTVGGDVDVDFLSIDNLCRKESVAMVETIGIDPTSHIKTLSLSNIVQENDSGHPFPLLKNKGVIDKLYMYNVDSTTDDLIQNTGTINFKNII